MAFNSALKSRKALALLSKKIEILHIQRLRTIFSAYSRLPRFRMHSQDNGTHTYPTG